MKHQHKKRRTARPAGKGLSGFVLGLLLATVVIAGVLFFLNQNKTPFRQPPTAQPTPPTEILTPGTRRPSAAPPNRDDDALGDFIVQQQQTPPAASTETQARETTPPGTDGREAAPEPAPTPVKPTTVATETKDKDKPSAPPKVSPKQILDSGSLEKAQQAAQAQAGATEAATKPNPSGKVRLQIGSFKEHDAADAQRAKLAMLGVPARVVPGKANGSTVYRVETAGMSRQQAEETAARLRQNRIDSLMRQAP